MEVVFLGREQEIVNKCDLLANRKNTKSCIKSVPRGKKSPRSHNTVFREAKMPSQKKIQLFCKRLYLLDQAYHLAQ